MLWFLLVTGGVWMSVVGWAVATREANPLVWMGVVYHGAAWCAATWSWVGYRLWKGGRA
jgi:hypothetical protein